MTLRSRYERTRDRLAAGWRNRALSLKALSFALVGVVNTVVDYGVFLLARAAFNHWSAALGFFASASAWCQCGGADSVALVAANTVSWIVAVSGSYVMNSTITFAAETGRKLKWRDYFTFVLSGVAGWLANTATLIVAAEVLMLPVWLAKLVAILASFVVNFALSHFVVFRVRPKPASNAE